MKINTLILAASIFLSFGSQAAEKQYTITKPHNFPVKPGPRAWAQLADGKAACEVPAKVLEAMTTEALLQTCLDYPFKPDPNLFSDLHQIPEHCFNCFDGFKELATRPDAGQLLVQYYALLSKALEKASSMMSPDYQFYLDIHFFHELLHASRIKPLFNPAQKEQLDLLRKAKKLIKIGNIS
jgi:hypothetical protein